MMAAPGTKQAILDSLLENARHFGPLREYDYDWNMPLLLNPPEKALACRETQQEFEHINSSFSAQIHALFEALRDFESRATSTNGGALIGTDGLQLAIRVNNQSFDIYPSCLHRNFHSRRLFLGEEDDSRNATSLPQLSHVTTLRLHPARDYAPAITFVNTRPVSPRLLMQLASRCPKLREIDCPWLWERTPAAFRLRSVRHFTRPWEGPWRNSRHEFGRAVRELINELPASLRVARLWFWQPSAFYSESDQGVPMPDLVWPQSEDPLSIGVRDLASRMEELDLRAFLRVELFKTPLTWPHMKRLCVEFHPWCPDGTWYFVGPGDERAKSERGFEVTGEHYSPEEPNELDDEIDEEYVEDEGTEEEVEYTTDMFRVIPCSTKIEPLLLAFAQALECMPALEEAQLFAYLAWQPSEERQRAYKGADNAPFNMNRAIYRWGVTYAPGRNGQRGSVTWQVGTWRLQQGVIQAFNALDGQNGGADIVWKPFEFLQQRMDLDPTDFH